MIEEYTIRSVVIPDSRVRKTTKKMSIDTLTGANDYQMQRLSIDVAGKGWSGLTSCNEPYRSSPAETPRSSIGTIGVKRTGHVKTGAASTGLTEREG